MNLTLEEKLKVCNWFYKLGRPIISDIKYNQMFEELKRVNPNSEVVTKTWSELGKPTEELIKANALTDADKIEEELKSTSESGFFLPPTNMEYREKYYQETLDYFEQFIPKSIETIEDVNTSSSWLYTVKDNEEWVDINFSIKADGFNISLFYYRGYYIGARTRGRAGSAEDVSIAMSKVVPMFIDVPETYIRIKSEAVMEKESLLILREKDKTREWKSTRSSIRTLLMNDIGEEYNKYIIPLAFKMEGRRFQSMKKEYLFLEMMGFKVVENRTERIRTNEELLNVVKEFSSMDLIYNNDGCVTTVDDYEVYNKFETSGKYDFAMRAYRLFNWQSSIYCSLILGVEPSYNTKRISLQAKIYPTKVSNGSTVSSLDVDNLARLQTAKVKLGSVVAFHVRSDAYPDWLDMDSMIINSRLSKGETLPEHLIQPVAELESRIMEQFGDKIKERGLEGLFG